MDCRVPPSLEGYARFCCCHFWHTQFPGANKVEIYLHLLKGGISARHSKPPAGHLDLHPSILSQFYAKHPRQKWPIPQATTDNSSGGNHTKMLSKISSEEHCFTAKEKVIHILKTCKELSIHSTTSRLSIGASPNTIGFVILTGAASLRCLKTFHTEISFTPSIGTLNFECSTFSCVRSKGAILLVTVTKQSHRRGVCVPKFAVKIFFYSTTPSKKNNFYSFSPHTASTNC